MRHRILCQRPTHKLGRVQALQWAAAIPYNIDLATPVVPGKNLLVWTGDQ